jgi:hypothetical protein
LDGISLKPLLLGMADSWPDRMIFTHWNRKVSVRSQQFRLDDAGQLFDMVQDPKQRKNITAENPAVARRLQTAVDDWEKTVLAELDRKVHPFTVGYSEFPITRLPARDGVPHGQIQRSAGAPNCSYFTNWKTTEDFISWDIEVATPGTYEAVVFYTCKESDAGCRVELAFQESKVEAKVAKPHDPPLVGEKEDRVSRQGESYVKDFAPLPLGTIQLSKGQGQLSLKALEIPGAGCIEVRDLVLTLKK